MCLLLFTSHIRQVAGPCRVVDAFSGGGRVECAYSM